MWKKYPPGTRVTLATEYMDEHGTAQPRVYDSVTPIGGEGTVQDNRYQNECSLGVTVVTWDYFQKTHPKWEGATELPCHYVHEDCLAESLAPVTPEEQAEVIQSILRSAHADLPAH